MGGEKPQLTEKPVKGGANDLQLAFLEETGFADKPIQAFETIPIEKMSGKDIAVPGSSPTKAHSPANPPEPSHKIDKEQIHLREAGKNDSGFRAEVSGQPAGDNATECQIVYDWSTHKTKPGNLVLDQIETTYLNTAVGSKQLGKDITFVDANLAVGKDTKRVGRYPTHDINRDGYDCEIESYPVRDSNGDYVVRLSRAFASQEGKVEKATTERINGQNYEHRYSTQVFRYARQSPDGDPEGLKSISYYADEDGGTTKKVSQVNYVDEKGQRHADGSPVSTFLYDLSKPVETKLRTIEHAQFNGKTVVSSITEHNFLNAGGSRTLEYNPADQQWIKDTQRSPDGTILYVVERNLSDQTVSVTMNGMLALDPKGKKSSGTIIFKQDKNQEYSIDNIEIRDSSGKKELTIKASALKFVYNNRSEIIGIEGADFQKKDEAKAAQALAKFFSDDNPDGKSNRKLFQGIIDVLNPKKK